MICGDMCISLYGVDIDPGRGVHIRIPILNILYIITIRGETVTKDNQNVHVFK